MIELFKLWFFKVLYFQNWVTTMTVILIWSINWHHTGTACSNMRLVIHRSKLYTSLVIHSTLTNIRTVNYIIFIIETHQPVLLLLYFIFLEVGTAFTLIPFQIMTHIYSGLTLGNIRITLWVSRIYSFIHAVILG